MLGSNRPQQGKATERGREGTLGSHRPQQGLSSARRLTWHGFIRSLPVVVRLLQHPCHAKVGKLHAILQQRLAAEHVARGQVSVHNADVLQVDQGIGDLRADADQVPRRYVLHHLGQALLLAKLPLMPP